MNNNDTIILIAEDDPAAFRILEKNLRKSGISSEIIHFQDGSELLDFLDKKQQDNPVSCNTRYLLLLDICMPKIDGVSVLKTIKTSQYWRKLPVIMLTTSDDPKEIERCYDLGCNNYVTKSVDYEEFISRIENLGFFIKVLAVPTC